MNGFEANQPPLSIEELQELEELLVSARLRSGAMTLDELDGFLASLAIGPAPVAPEEWIPVVLGNGNKEQSSEGSCDTRRKLTALIVRYANSIEAIFSEDPDAFRPLFELSTYACTEDEESAVQAWAHAFMIGMEMRYDEWAPLIDMAELADEDGERSAMLLGPVLLLSGLDSRSESLPAEQREQLGKMIAGSIIDIYRFWLPFRDLYTGEK